MASCTSRWGYRCVDDELLRLAASAERYSEHPLAEAVRAAARERGLVLAEPRDFVAEPGVGVRATVDGVSVAVGSRRLVSDLTGFVGNQPKGSVIAKTCQVSPLRWKPRARRCSS